MRPRAPIFRDPGCRLCRFWIFLLCLWLALSPAPLQAGVKNVILMIMDGCSFEHLTLARWAKGAPLALDDILVGAVKTHSLDAVITDSAAAATAFATGHLTRRGALGLIPEPKEGWRPRATLLEGAKLQGKATGIVVTSRISHATPAAFYAHVPARRDEALIMQQAVHQNLTLALGGGRRLLSQELQQELHRQGYQILTTREDLAQCRSLPVFGLFAAEHLAPEIDRLATAPDQPSLAEMTAKALELLASHPQGFFLLIEGSQIDFANHVHDPGYLLGELQQFDLAVQQALDFARRDGHTLLVVAADHNTGGFSLGNSRSQEHQELLTPEALLAPLRPLKASARRLWQSLGPEPTAASLQRQLAALWGLQLSNPAAAALLASAQRPGVVPEQVLSDFFCQHYTFLGWTTGGHTGGDVPLFAYGPGKPSGLLTAPEIGRQLAAALGFDLEEVSQRLFVPLPQILAAVSDGGLEETESEVVLKQGHSRLRLPLHKNLLFLNGSVRMLEGLVLACPPANRLYLPRQVAEILQAGGP